MTDPLDRACDAAWDTLLDDPDSWYSCPGDRQQATMRLAVAAALQVIAGDLRAQTATWHAEYEAYARDGEVLAACADAIDEILDRYVGEQP